MTLRFAGSHNGYMPQLTGQVIAFVRKESEFKLNEYVQYVPTKKKLGVYTKLELDAFVRVHQEGRTAWHDGASRKEMGKDNKIRFEMTEFRTNRRNFAWEIGWQSLDQTDAFKIKPAHMDMALSQCMTERTKRVISLCETVANWGSNTATADTLNGGKGTWDTATADPSDAAGLAIYKSCIAAAQRINLATNGKVKPSDLRFVVSPSAAIAMSSSAEMVNYVRESPASEKLLTEGFDPQFDLWGLPRMYRGFTFIVEDAVIVEEYQKASGTEATANRSYIKTDDSCVVLARKGGLDGEYGTVNFSTLQFYHYDGLLKVAAFDDAEDELTRGHVSEDTKEVLAAPISGYLIQDIL